MEDLRRSIPREMLPAELRPRTRLDVVLTLARRLGRFTSRELVAKGKTIGLNEGTVRVYLTRLYQEGHFTVESGRVGRHPSYQPIYKVRDA